MEADLVSEERRGKGNQSKPRGFSGSKIVFILLTEVIAVHMGLFTIYVRGTGLQLLSGHLKDDESWGKSGSESSSLQNGLKNLLQIIFAIHGDISSGNRGVSNKGFYLSRSTGLVGQFVT